jgi:hypothetical protein
MIEYIQNTGLISNNEDYYNLGQISNGLASINSLTPFVNDVYINGQTLLETSAEITTVGGREVIFHTGDFFLSGSTLRAGSGFADFSNFKSDNIKHDFIDSGQHPFFFSSDHNDLITGFSGAAGNLAGDLVFINGVKLVSGQDYIEDSNGNFNYIGTTTETGFIFSMPVKEGLFSSGIFDLTGVFFNKGTTIGYLNGMRLDNEDILETSSLLLDIIETGLENTVTFITKSETPNTIVF